MYIKLNTPSLWVFLLSTALVIVVLLVKYTSLDMSIFRLLVQNHEFQTMLIAWAILFASVAFKL
jgi:hypothetical protein